MATDVERLVVAIEAQTRQFERQINRLEQQVGGSMRRNARSVNTLDRSMKAAAASAANFMRAFAVGAGAAALTGLPAAVNSAVSAVADLGNAANRAGASAESLQVLRRGLEQNGASARDADDAMRRLTRRMGEFANSGSGPAKNAIEGLGLEVFDLEGNLRSSDEILRQIAQRFGQIENPAIAAAYAAQLFGDDAGPRLVPLLMQGERALNSFEAQLRDANALMSNESVQAAVEMEDAYNALMSNVTVRWQTFAVNIARGATSMVESVRQASLAIADAANETFDSSRSPEQRLAAALSARNSGFSVQGDQDFANFFDRSSFNMPSSQSSAEIVDPRHAQALRELQGRLAATEESTRRVTQAFGHFGTTAEQSARTAGSALRDVAGEPLDLLSDQINTANDNVRNFDQSLGDLARNAISDVSSALSDGKIEWQEWAQIGLNAINSLLGGMNQVGGAFGSMGGGGGLLGGGGFLSSIFGSFGLPSFDGGGFTGHGSRSGGIDGKGGFLAINHPNETIFDHTRGAANSNAPQQTVIYQTNYITNPFGMEGVEQAIQQGNQAVLSQVPGVSVNSVTNRNRRAPGSLG